ncbi:MAG TPA: hypothetical protein VEH04_07535 [Verrucomicrobiae bacterium]|nr:hypothetical protein [Verrucomicrobiae bacterium]
MIAFELYLNGKKVCTAGVGDLGVLSSCLVWRGAQPYQKGGSPVSEYIKVDVGGLAGSGEHLWWVERNLKRGEVVAIKVVETDRVDKPRKRQRPDPKGDLRRQKQYVRRMAKQFGWKIQT